MNLYERIIEKIFLANYRPGSNRVPFAREDIERAAKEMGLKLPKNFGDLIYSFRFRSEFPASIKALAPKGTRWTISLEGRAKYAFVASVRINIVPRPDLAVIKVPDATPGLITRYALSDEQALLAKLRYNRLVDIFSGLTCYSLQSHLRTSTKKTGQIEIDEVYIGVDRRGAHYVLPVQAKGGRDKQSVEQVRQDYLLCTDRFPQLVCRPIAAQFMNEEVIALFELAIQADKVVVVVERHYKLVPPGELTAEELVAYQNHSPE